MDYRNITKIVRNMQLYKNKISSADLNENELEIARYLTKHPAGLSQNEIALYLNVDKALVSRMIKKLFSRGYIVIAHEPSDRRIKLIRPTAKSTELKDEIREEETRFYETITAVLTNGEKTVLNTLVEKIYLESKRLRKNKFQGM